MPSRCQATLFALAVLLPQGSKPEPTKKLSFQTYSRELSQRLFAACDLNADDRISFPEACEAIDGFDGDRAKAKFRQVDTDKRGFVEFDEFDREFHSRINLKATLTLTLLASERLNKMPAGGESLDPSLLRFFSSLDKNHDERIDAKEWAEVGSMLGADARTEMIRLDSDQSGDLTVRELQSLLDLVKRHEAEPVAASRSQRQLPEHYRTADVNQDSMLDQEEVTRAMFRIHPSLARYAKRVFEQADTETNGRIDVFELQRHEVRR